MRFKLLTFIFCFSSPLFAQLAPSYNMTKRYSVRQLEEWLKKDNRPRFTNPANYGIRIQLNSNWTNTHRMLGTVSQVGSGTTTPSNNYGVTANIDYLYKSGRFWAEARTTFRGNGGLFGGSNSFALKRAHIGWNVTTYGPFECAIQAGRKAFTKIYNSQIQYGGEIDGVSLIAMYPFGKVVEARFTSGAYISYARAFWIIRGTLFNIANTGLYYDYSYIHWGMMRPDRATNGIDVRFNTSQFLAGWEYKPQLINKDIRIFGAFIVNHGATVNFLTQGSKEKTAGYVGFQFGTLKKQNDFSIQAQLQFCRLQAIAPWNAGGIGTGARAGQLFTATSSQTVNTTTNFKGWEATANYAVTDQLTFTGRLARSVPMNRNIGIPFNYTTFKLETQYVF